MKTMMREIGDDEQAEVKPPRIRLRTLIPVTITCQGAQTRVRSGRRVSESLSQNIHTITPHIQTASPSPLSSLTTF